MRPLLHAITPDSVSPSRAGLGGRPLDIVEVDGLFAWVTRIGAPIEPFRRADLLDQHAIITWIHERTQACLPARFPGWLDLDQVRTKRAELIAALERVRDRSELALTALWTGPAGDEPRPEPATPGTAYLLQRQRAFAASDRRRERAQQLAAEIENSLGDDLVEVQHRVCPSAAVALSSALLVPRARADGLISVLVRAEQDVRILVNGPWPAYTFAAVV